MLKLQNKITSGLHSSGHKPAKNAGFTLMELMIVVVIIGVVASLAFSNFHRLNKQMDFDAHYHHVMSSVQKCRAEALQRSNPVTSPTTLVFFTNGFACISWDDFNTGGPNRLGGGGAINMGSDGILDVGEADSEVRAVYFENRFDPTLDLNGVATKIKIDTAASVLQSGTYQDDSSGYAFIFASGGYVLASDRTKITAKVFMKPLEGIPSGFVMYSSGQMVGQ